MSKIDWLVVIVVCIGVLAFLYCIPVIDAQSGAFNKLACEWENFTRYDTIDSGEWFDTEDQTIMCYNLDGSTMLLDFGEEK